MPWLDDVSVFNAAYVIIINWAIGSEYPVNLPVQEVFSEFISAWTLLHQLVTKLKQLLPALFVGFWIAHFQRL
jgi:hypothetical protein